jgi:SAM-dependent methyltransferase
MIQKAGVAERPDLYDWLYSHFDEDVEMYIKLAEQNSVALECGIGTGRIAIPMAEKGITVFGIDNSETMLKALDDKLAHKPKTVREKIKPILTDLRDFSLGKTFNYIFIPFSTFNYLLNLDDQKKALRCINSHLEPGGRLVIELISFSLFPDWLNNNHNLIKSIQKKDEVSGKITEMWRSFRFDSSSQIIEQDRHYRFYNENGDLENEILVLWKNRLFFVGEIQLLLELSGFRVDDVYGDCEFGPYTHKSEFFVVVARKVGKEVANEQ